MGQFSSTLGQVGTQLRRQSSPIPFAGDFLQKIQPTCLEANLTYMFVITPFWGPQKTNVNVIRPIPNYGAIFFNPWVGGNPT